MRSLNTYLSSRNKTVAYRHKQARKDMIKKITTCLVFIFLTSFAFGQIGFHFEYSNKYKTGAGIDFGHNFGNNYIGVTTHVYFTRLRSVPVEAGLIYSYSIGQFQPFISGGFYTCGNEALSEKEGTRGFHYGGGVAYQFNNSPVRLSAGITGNNIFLTVGLFKNL